MRAREAVIRGSLVVALLALLALGGCAGLPKFEAPHLSVMSIKMQSADIFSQRLTVHMRVMNPNDRALPVKGITYRIEVNGAELADGASDSPFTVPAMGEAEFDVAVTANLAGALSKWLAHGQQDTVDYRLVGNVALASGFLRRVPFDEHGSVKLK